MYPCDLPYKKNWLTVEPRYTTRDNYPSVKVIVSNGPNPTLTNVLTIFKSHEFRCSEQKFPLFELRFGLFYRIGYSEPL